MQLQECLHSYYREWGSHHTVNAQPIDLVTNPAVRWPECRIEVLEQRPGQVDSEIGDLKDHIGIYRRLNAEPGIGNRDQTMADSITELDCRHFRNFARNWTPAEIENLPQNRRRICGPSLNEQLIAQYFVRLHFTQRAGLDEEDRLRRMRLLMPYRTDEFVTNLFEYWNRSNNRFIFNAIRDEDGVENQIGCALETREHELYYNDRNE